MEDVLVDAATRHQAGSILKQLRGHPVSAHALTHAHPDHQGATHEVCTKLGIPLACGEGDVEAMEIEGEIVRRQPPHPINRFFYKVMAGPPHKVDRVLREGDEIAGFRVLEVPGHSAGHVAFWRESDRVLIAGDVFNNADPFTLLPGVREPKKFFTPDPARNRESMRRLAALEPALMVVGHGPPLRDPTKLAQLIAKLPSH
jgi:glyoxylase-like metal-dependent hydrolase (beta-lactamase superfamily II)